MGREAVIVIHTEGEPDASLWWGDKFLSGGISDMRRPRSVGALTGPMHLVLRSADANI